MSMPSQSPCPLNAPVHVQRANFKRSDRFQYRQPLFYPLFVGWRHLMAFRITSKSATVFQACSRMYFNSSSPMPCMPFG
jgi:hypothetical protein